MLSRNQGCYTWPHEMCQNHQKLDQRVIVDEGRLLRHWHSLLHFEVMSPHVLRVFTNMITTVCLFPHLPVQWWLGVPGDSYAYKAKGSKLVWYDCFTQWGPFCANSSNSSFLIFLIDDTLRNLVMSHVSVDACFFFISPLMVHASHQLSSAFQIWHFSIFICVAILLPLAV